MNKRLLVVEDSRAMMLAVEAMLAETTALPVDAAASLAEASSLLRSHAAEYAAAVIDLHLPDADNGEMVDLALSQGIPVIVLTGDLNEGLRRVISARPIVDYVIKQSVNSIRVVGQDVCRLMKNPGRRVLIVGDQTRFCAQLRATLENQKLPVAIATSATEAHDMVARHADIALTLIDFHLPEQDGIALTAALRARYPATQMAIIGIYDSEDLFVSVRFIKAGADDVLRKPFLTEELVSRVNARLDNLENIRTIVDQANLDYLTGLHNRRYLFDAGQALYENARRNHIRMMVALLDIDHFKKINDTWGHAAGDTVLCRVASEIRGMLRKSDLVARIGGEELCIVAVNTDSPWNLVENIRQRIEALEISVGPAHSTHLTLSAGVTEKLCDSLDAMLRRADAALYEAKANGRNQTVLDV